MSASYDYEKELDCKISKFIGNNEFLWNKNMMDYHNQGKKSAVLQLIYNKTRTQEVDDHVMARITYWQNRWHNFGKNRCELMKCDQHSRSRKRDTNGINQQRTSTMAATSISNAPYKPSKNDAVAFLMHASCSTAPTAIMRAPWNAPGPFQPHAHDMPLIGDNSPDDHDDILASIYNGNISAASSTDTEDNQMVRFNHNQMSMNPFDAEENLRYTNHNGPASFNAFVANHNSNKPGRSAERPPSPRSKNKFNREDESSVSPDHGKQQKIVKKLKFQRKDKKTRSWTVTESEEKQIEEADGSSPIMPFYGFKNRRKDVQATAKPATAENTVAAAPSTIAALDIPFKPEIAPKESMAKTEIGERASIPTNPDVIFCAWIASEFRKLNEDLELKMQLQWQIQKAVASTTAKLMNKLRTTNRPIRSTRYQ